jgi:peptidoglycan/xylan/chitin deacetylase (PgdA/CDA1 family)
MEPRRLHLGGPEREREQAEHVRRARWAAVASLVVVAAVALVIVLSTTGGSSSRTPTPTQAANRPSAVATTPRPSGGVTAPILAYHVINQPPAQSALPSSLYVPPEQFTAQMQALKAAGWHAVTLDQLEANWTRGAPLSPGKPIVITFDNGYASQYKNALPVLKQLGWVGVENLQVNGLSPADGGLSDAQVRGLIGAGWELDAAGLSQADLTVLDAAQLNSEVASARQTLRSRYGVPVNWFSYPSGRYDPTVVASVRQAGYVGATTGSPGWASPQADRFRLPRLEVVADTSPSQLLSQITAARQTTTAPPSSTGT